MRRWRLMNCSPALQRISIRRFEREVLGCPRFPVSRGQYGDCKTLWEAAVNAFQGVQPRLFEA